MNTEEDRYMQGEIMVGDVMERVERRKLWRARQARDAEWTALKQWWRAEQRVRRASGTPEYQRAVTYRAQTARLYRAELARAWPKWARVQAELRSRGRRRW